MFNIIIINLIGWIWISENLDRFIEYSEDECSDLDSNSEDEEDISGIVSLIFITTTPVTLTITTTTTTSTISITLTITTTSTTTNRIIYCTSRCIKGNYIP